ncbi:DUF1992 domain-containing protein [Glutamicibacter sp.]|uniref:DnaJ family domain-containing protein n=1 Tax=Glutamicibacter sp. TaxID=1931995 RepID=UPI0028BE0C7B|nr:DUF1992 domain-containing protein [Glutamicibacter sp.]
MAESNSIQPLMFCNPSAFVYDTETIIALLADVQIRRAIKRGEFDNLPGSGKPIDISDAHDPDWWFKSLVKREGLALLPPSIQLRKDDAALDEVLDQLPTTAAVRREVEEFNERVIRARYLLPDGPPLTTMPRDVEIAVAAWAERRAARTAMARQKAIEEEREREELMRNKRRRFFSRRGRGRSRRDAEN